MLTIIFYVTMIALQFLAQPTQDIEIEFNEKLDNFVLLTDGKDHFIFIPKNFLEYAPDFDNYVFYYGNGKSFWKADNPVCTGVDQELKKLDVSLYDPRFDYNEPGKIYATFRIEEGNASFSCGEKSMKFVVVNDEKTKEIFAGAKFYRNPRLRKPYALLRDNKGNYFYVDRGRWPENESEFRVFFGKKGNLKQMKLKNIVHDSEGDIFSTASGSLRLIMSKQSAEWATGKSHTKLTIVPMDMNMWLIYNELGVYLGERVGTPCDFF